MNTDHELSHSNGGIWAPQRIEDLSADSRHAISQVIDAIPDLPLSVNRIIEMAGDLDSNLRDLVELVSSDPTLVSNILKVVNSSYYGLRNKTDNLHLAIVLLGFKEVKQIAMRSFIRRSFGATAESREQIASHWEHSYMVSVMAESFCAEDDQQRRGVLLTLGLLHDIGKFVMSDLAHLLVEHGLVIEGMPTPSAEQYSLANEERQYGINHALVGYLLGERWNLSNRFLAVLRHHHAPSFYGMSEIAGDYLEEVTMICIADLLVHRYMGTNTSLPAPHQLFFAQLGLEPPLEDLLTPERRALLDQAHEFITSLQ